MIANLELLKEIESKLESAGVLSPKTEAEMLLTHFGQIDRMQLFTGEKEISPSVRASIEKVLKVRRKGTPLAYLLGRAPFYGRYFRVTKDTLIPRPETEVLLTAALEVLKAAYAGKNPQILDLGTGTGCIGLSLTLEYPACKMTALDASSKALAVARNNSRLLGLGKKVRFVQGRFFRSFRKEKWGFWNLIVTNPPYVPREDWGLLSKEVKSEPRLALDGGKAGLESVTRILKDSPRFLASGGWLLMEIGLGQSAALAEILSAKGGSASGGKKNEFKEFSFLKDLNGIDRVLVAKKHG